MSSVESQNISCKKGQVHNGIACICDTGFHLSLGKCINTIYLTCFITIGAVAVAFILVSSVLMYREGKHVNTTETNQIQIMRRFSHFQNYGRSDDDELADTAPCKLPPPSQVTTNALAILSNAVST